MYLLFTDETNTAPQNDSRIKFFAYGGLIFPLEKIHSISEGIANIRSLNGYKPTDSLKFDTRTKPDGVTPENFAAIKNQVIQLCINSDCKFLSYVVLHKIAQKTGINKTIKWGADHIVGKFNYYLSQRDARGIVIVDRLTDLGEYKFLAEKFTVGLLVKDVPSPLDRIVLFSSSCDNASHLSSAMDIVLGSFRYCINQPYKQGPAKVMMNNLVKLIWADGDGNLLNPHEKGLTMRPKEISIPEYKKEYDDLIDHINTLLKE